MYIYSKHKARVQSILDRAAGHTHGGVTICTEGISAPVRQSKLRDESHELRMGASSGGLMGPGLSYVAAPTGIPQTRR